jgi:hypothetical protein
MNMNIEKMEGAEYAKMKKKYISDPSSFVRIDHQIFWTRVFYIDPKIRENLCCEDFLDQLVSCCNDLTCSSTSPAKAITKIKKRSLKPTKPLTDEERDQFFGNQSTSSDQATKKKITKKKKSKAPNATRKTKKPTRL